jgi:methylase of polypeptide subunit release factors
MVGTSAPQIALEEAAVRLGTALRGLGYSEQALDALHEDALDAGVDDVAALTRRLRRSSLATMIEALFLARPVSRRDAVRAIGERGVAALHATGLAEVGNEVLPRARVIPVSDLLIAGDTFSKGRDDAADYVTPFSPTSRICAALTPRRRVRTALDVGTGSGAQALFAARHADRVIATDVNDRALDFTRLNASLNGLTNIECRRGGLFEPVGDEHFDLITCNAPYVVSPERRWLYRDAGLEGDELSAQVLEGAAARLADGGFATLNLSWLAESEDAPDESVLEWIDTSTCEAWVLVAWEADPLDHAAGWVSETSHDVDEIGNSLDEWTRYFDELDARWVSEGTVVLHRRRGKRRTVRIDSIEPDLLGVAAEQVARAFAAREQLSRLTRRDELLDYRLRLDAKLQSEEEVEPKQKRRTRKPAVVSLAEGTNSTVETTAGAVEVIRALDGTATLETAIRTVARDWRLDDADALKLRRDALWLARELLELGALTFAS